jgi:hypothetical protein
MPGRYDDVQLVKTVLMNPPVSAIRLLSRQGVKLGSWQQRYPATTQLWLPKDAREPDTSSMTPSSMTS